MWLSEGIIGRVISRVERDTHEAELREHGAEVSPRRKRAKLELNSTERVGSATTSSALQVRNSRSNRRRCLLGQTAAALSDRRARFYLAFIQPPEGRVRGRTL